MKKLVAFLLLCSVAIADTPPPILSFSSPLNKSGTAVSCQTASGSQGGCITAGQYTTFNSKQAAIAGNSCSVHQFADSIDTTGTIACAALQASDIPVLNQNTTGNAATATALAANPTDCSANQYATTIDASGNLTCAQVAYSQVTGTPSLHYQTVQANTVAQTQRSNLNFSSNFTSTDSSGSDRSTIDLAATITAALSGNASTATALASTPAQCSANNYATGITAAGVANCAQVGYSQVTGTPTLRYQTVQLNASAQTQRSNLNFSSDFTSTDSAGSDRTTIASAATNNAITTLPNVTSLGAGTGLVHAASGALSYGTAATGDIANNAVTAAKIANNTVDYGQLATDVLQTADLTLNHSQILALNTTPIQIVAAPGAGFALRVVGLYCTGVFNTSAYTSAGNLSVVPSGHTASALATCGATVIPVSSGSVFISAGQSATQSLFDNTALVITVGSGNPTGSSADSTIKLRVFYSVVPDPLP